MEENELVVKLKELEDRLNQIEQDYVSRTRELEVTVPVIDFGLDELTEMPVRKKDGDCGYDAYSLETVTIPAHSGGKVPLGIGLIIPEPFGVKAETRSGNFIKGLSIGSAWVDRGYRGQINALVQNITDEPITINKGDRPCAIELEMTFKMNLVPAKEYYTEEEYKEIMNTERGSTAFGSSGR